MIFSFCFTLVGLKRDKSRINSISTKNEIKTNIARGTYDKSHANDGW
jgi:hypothetical protein